MKYSCCRHATNSAASAKAAPALALALARDTSATRAGRLFHFSLLYLAVLFVAMAADTVIA